MEEQLVTCPSCGARGIVGYNCEYCGSLIHIQESCRKNKEIPSNKNPVVVSEMTVTPEEYARRISLFQKIETDPNYPLVSKVYIGNKVGLININGEFLVPLQDDEIRLYEGYFRYIAEVPTHKPTFYQEIFDKEQKFIKASLMPFVPGILIDLKTSEIYKNISIINGDLYAPEGDEIVPNIVELKRIKLLNWEQWKIEKEKVRAKNIAKNEIIKQKRDKEEKEMQRVKRITGKTYNVLYVVCVVGFCSFLVEVLLSMICGLDDILCICEFVSIGISLICGFLIWIVERIEYRIIDNIKSRYDTSPL